MTRHGRLILQRLGALAQALGWFGKAFALRHDGMMLNLMNLPMVDL
ncbi:hypothetical protein [Laceyella sediminis]|jgi:hypothetical protein|nr:hypothetical protein [Laceyella sediminis]